MTTMALRREFGDVGALEVLIQTCNFAFMNRFTDGLRLASEDEAIRSTTRPTAPPGCWRLS